jgi:hypothetical protein
MSDITQALAGLVKSGLERKDFSTGSKGFFTSGKITTADGTRYQAQATAILIGSKDKPKVKAQASAEEVRTALTAMIPRDLAGRTFSSGRKGYHAQARIEAHGQCYQASVQAVRLS